MPYSIELMSLGEDQYPLLAAAANSLNAVQNEFHFRVTSESQRQIGISFQRKNYYSPDIWRFLREHRTASGGNRPYIIAFVNAPLASPVLKNLFGSHEGKEGLAVVTLHQSTQYVKEARRYCCYFLVRYAMSFVNPLIKAHDHPQRSSCYFHMKMYKPDIRLSMDSGHLCDECIGNLERPTNPSIGKALSADEHEALKKMRAVVSDDYPRALIMKGGGVKSLAFAGALQEIEKYFWFDVHVGASAGAITAVLLAANYSPTELSQLLLKKSFREFMDARTFFLPFNLIFRRGLYPGQHFLDWMTELLRAKIPSLGEIRMRDLPSAMRNSGKHAVIYACTSGSGTLVFDSGGERKDENAAFATRCSMSIPIFFVPPEIGGRRVYDGGMRNNFPLTRFLQDNPDKPFIALYLGKTDDSGRKWIWSELADIWVTGEEYKSVDSHRESVIVIDTSPIGTVDFRLSEKEKDFLVEIGKAAALRFLYDRNLDDGPDREAVETAESEAEASRKAIVKMRRRGRLLKTFLFVGALVLLFGIGYWMWHG
jgi:predicted acylesterase/phospholipase RssA